MVSYRQTKRELTPYFGENSITNYVLSGGMAEIASSFIWTPMEVVKGRMQISSSGIGTFALMKEIKQNEGIKGFFRGYWMGIVVFLPHSIVWWTTYEEAKRILSERKGSLLSSTQQTSDISDPDAGTDTSKPVMGELMPLQYAIASASATVVSQTATNLLDVVKTRQQLAVSREISSLRPDDQLGVWQVGRNLIKEVGFFRACFKGLHMRLLQSLPSSVLSMVIVETLNPDVSKRDLVRQAFEEEEQVI